MLPSQVKVTHSFDYWFKPESILPGEPVSPGVRIFKLTTQRDKYILDKIFVSLVDRNQQDNLNFYLYKGCAYLCEVMQTAPDGSIFVKLLFYYGKEVIMNEITVGITKKEVEAAKRGGVRALDINDLARQLEMEVNIIVDGKPYFLILEGYAARDEFVDKNEPAEDEKSNVHKAFSIYGNDLRIPVEYREQDKFNASFHVKRLIVTAQTKQDVAIRLVAGRVKFAPEPGNANPAAAMAVNQIIARDGDYMKTWDMYGEMEETLLMERAREIGALSFINFEPIGGDKIKCFIKGNLPQKLKKGDIIEFTDDIPLYLIELEITYKEYLVRKASIPKKGKTLTVNVVETNKNPASITVEMPKAPDVDTKAILSILGEEAQIRRRDTARQSLLDGTCGNPVLPLLLEENDFDIPKPEIREIYEPLSERVKESVFSTEPTERQIEAIRRALNAADIVMIQGPPGTGKTTIIKAILERLNEEFDKTGEVKGQALVSGYQHDAVNNLIARLKINSLPQIKFGGRDRDDGFSEVDINKRIDEWRDDLTKRVRAENPGIKETKQEREIGVAWNNYCTSPGTPQARYLLRSMMGLPPGMISPKHMDEVRAILVDLDEDENEESAKIIDRSAIFSLRVTEESFADDGKQRAAEAYVALKDKLNTSEAALLHRAMAWRRGDLMDFINGLRSLRKKYLILNAPKPTYNMPKLRDDIIKLSVGITEAMKRTRSRTDKKSEILADFLDQLQNAPGRVRRAISDYNFVYAATVQGSAAGEIIEAKIGEDKYKQPRYDTVIIDEAARVSARDLLIPMSQGVKRIILVGDHRQLPQMIDDEVVEKMESDDAYIFDKNILKESVFGYLFKRLQKLEAKDNVVRAVTLNKQYRMHRLLGDFISKNFYENENKNEKFTSPLPDEVFAHDLPGMDNKPLLWMNKPCKGTGDKQKKDEGSTSYHRMSEVEAISERFVKWLDFDKEKCANDTKRKKFTFGIISFYKAQCEKLEDKLKKLGVNENDMPKIGTVDSFQGMEFDVVFLSIVRCMDPDPTKRFPPDADTYEKKMQSLFGFLMLPNRLCVSLSRQKKVLAVAGDGSMAGSEYCEKNAPQIYELFKLASEQGVLE